jgi:uracil-DNA glycosylase family 4
VTVPPTPPGTDLDALGQEASGCTRCRLAVGRNTVVFGMGTPQADLVFVGEGPGAEEDRQGLPFVGRSGQLLDRILEEELGRSRASCYIANIVKCRPPGNRDPKPDEIEACLPWLESQLALLRPEVVVTLGNTATRTLLGTTQGVTRLRGRSYPWREAVLVPTYHPAAVLRGGPSALAEFRADLVRAKLALGGGARAGAAG